MSEEEKMLTVKQVAERFGVVKGVAAGWVQRGKFPNARKVPSGYEFDVWEIPESDVKGFTPQRRPGKPAVDNPSDAALAKRKSRAEKKR